MKLVDPIMLRWRRHPGDSVKACFPAYAGTTDSEPEINSHNAVPSIPFDSRAQTLSYRYPLRLAFPSYMANLAIASTR